MNNEVIRMITGAKVRCFSYECNKIGAISCETTPYFDVSQKSIKALDQQQRAGMLVAFGLKSYNLGPAATRALPASLVVYLPKFLMKRAARSLAFSSHSDALA